MSVEVSQIVTARFPKDEHAELSQLAAKFGLSMSQIVRVATRRLMEDERRKPGRYLSTDPGSIRRPQEAA
jgi:uncharacterized protein YdbL (DUF1318 family)